MTAGVRHDDLRRRNRALVLSAVRRSLNQISRTALAAETGLSHSTISAISSDLIAEGILSESKGSHSSSKRGRPQVGLALNPDATFVLSVALSMNFLTVTIIDYAGNTVAQEDKRLDTQALSRDGLVGECKAMITRLIEGAAVRGKPIARIVLAVQGTTDSEARAMLWSPITPQTDIPFADLLEDEFGIPVVVENDCNMMAVALRWRDPAHYRDDFISVLLSHGIGMGIVLRGQLFTGTHSSGGEFGHMVHKPNGALCRCGRRGCIEAYAGNYAIWRNAIQDDENGPPSADVTDSDIRNLAEIARARPGPERDAFRKAGEALGFGFGSLFALIDPVPVTMVGVGATAFDLIEPSLRDAIAQTSGGHHSKSITFDTEPDELALIHEGGAMRALVFVDQEIFAQGRQAPPAPARAQASLMA